MARYSYPLPTRHDETLHAEVASLGLPGFQGVAGSGAQVEILFAGDLTPAQLSTLDAKVMAHAGAPRRPKGEGTLAQEVLAWLQAPALPAGQLDRLQRLVSRLTARELRLDPSLARRGNVPLDGDEPGAVSRE